LSLENKKSGIIVHDPLSSVPLCKEGYIYLDSPTFQSKIRNNAKVCLSSKSCVV
jgi:hypothetical protein